MGSILAVFIVKVATHNHGGNSFGGLDGRLIDGTPVSCTLHENLYVE